jgi:4-hydroxy-3-methylbut-2-en-1-yl diphosphate reductase
MRVARAARSCGRNRRRFKRPNLPQGKLREITPGQALLPRQLEPHEHHAAAPVDRERHGGARRQRGEAVAEGLKPRDFGAVERTHHTAAPIAPPPRVRLRSTANRAQAERFRLLSPRPAPRPGLSGAAPPASRKPMSTSPRTIHLAGPRGFCAGVDRAIDIVEMALEVYGAPVYVRHEIVHNRHVVEALRAKGAVFVDELADVPAGARVIFSAHGVSPAIRDEAARRGLRAMDATCPLVTKVHLEALRYAKNGYTIVLVGHRHHVEVQGTMGEAPDSIVVVEDAAEAEKLQIADPTKVAYITQTTLSVDDCRAIVDVLRRRFPQISEPAKDDICYATQNRQNAVKELAKRAHVVLVVGAPASSNANRLVEVAQQHGATAYLIESAEDIRPEWIHGDIGITAGASTPEHVVQACVDRVREMGESTVQEFSLVEERVMFPLPGDLLVAAQERGVSVGAGNARAAERAQAEFRIRHH